MANFWNQVVEINRHKVQPAKRSASTTARQKQTSEYLNQKFGDVFPLELKEMGYQRVNFDADIKGNSIIVQKAFLIHDNGEVEILEMKSKHRMKGHSISTSLRKKVSGLAMSIQVPTPLILFHKEIETTFKEGFLVKMGLTAFFSSALMMAGITVEQLIMGLTFFTIIAVFEAALGLMPNTLKDDEDSKDHKLQAKFLTYVVNVMAMTVLLAVHLFMVNLTPDPGVLMYIPVNVHYIGIMYLLFSYVYRIYGYISVANKSKLPLPEFITKLIKKD